MRTLGDVEQELEKALRQIGNLRSYIDEQANLADKSFKEWEKEGMKNQADYRAGMWYAYNDIRNRLPVDPQILTSSQ